MKEEVNSVSDPCTHAYTATPFRFVRELAACNANGGGDEGGPFNKEVGYNKHTNKVPYGMLHGARAARRLRLRWRSTMAVRHSLAA